MATFDHKITPMLWFDGQAEEAAALYVSISLLQMKKLDIEGLRRAYDGEE
jgi:predicted 3-demethylubiquinone-9 3-methyltransferase (glyoxalase superfamily)